MTISKQDNLLPKEHGRFGYPLLAVNSYRIGPKKTMRARVWEAILDERPNGALRWTRTNGVQRYARLAARLLKMTPAELARRVQLAAQRRLWKRLPTSLLALPNFAAKAATLATTHKAALIHRVENYLSFDLNLSPKDRTQLSSDYVALIDSLIQAADCILREEVAVLGQPVRLIPGVLDWQADPISNRRLWPSRSLDEAEAISVSGGDAKYVWELNRHQFLPTLTRAYALTGNESYLERAASLIDDWIESNPYGIGINWCSHLEVSMRAISWLWALPVMLRWNRLPPDFLQKWLSSFAQHHSHLSRNLSVYTDPTNHLIGEATGLWMLSLCFPEIDSGGDALRRTEILLSREIERQVTSDGVGKEQATSYQRFVLEFYLQLIVLSRRAGRPLAKVVVNRVQQMLEFVAALAGMHGVSPMIGDSDDARAFPVFQASNWDFRDLLSIGAVLFKRADWKARAGAFPDTAIWLLGVDAINEFAALPEHLPVPLSKVFPEGGYCFFASATATGNAELIFDTGALGLWPNAAHGHADALSILLRVNGEFILNDPGTGTYFSDPEVRNNFRRTAAHSAVTVDGYDQADIYDVFKWVNPMRVQFEEHHVGADFDYAVAAHDGYRRLRKPVTHRRRVLFVKPYGFLIVDEFDGQGEHTFSRHFNFDPAVSLNYEYPNGVTAVHGERNAAIRVTFPESDGSGQCTPQLDHYGGWSSRYGEWRCAPRFKVETQSRAPLTLVTVVSLLAPEHHAVAGAKPGRVHETDGAMLWEGSLSGTADGTTDWLLMNPRGLAITLTSHRVQTNARIAFLRRRAEGTVERAFIAGEDTYLTTGEVNVSTNKKRYASVSRPAEVLRTRKPKA